MAVDEKANAAEVQHYVPQFILRNFLSDATKQQCTVFDKHTSREFSASIKGIMAERRFHDFTFDERYMASFEKSVGAVEDIILPTYQNVLRDRRLKGSAEEKVNLATLVAFQFVRTRATRDLMAHLEEDLKGKLEGWGMKIEDFEGYTPLTQDRIAEQHIRFMGDAIGKFTEILATKDFGLLAPADGRSFYLGDNPVSLHNTLAKPSFYGTIGLAVRGIEVYLPLSSDLMLCAWCPSILDQIRETDQQQAKNGPALLLKGLMDKRINQTQMRAELAVLNELRRPIRELLDSFSAGLPRQASPENMDFLNALQLSHSRRFVVCQQGDFRLARRFMKDNPGHSGRRLSIS